MNIRKAVIGWVISSAGTALWVYGYFVTGHPPMIDWHSHHAMVDR